MNAFARTGLAVLFLMALAQAVEAQNNPKVLPYGGYSVPQVRFYSHFVGKGEEIDQVISDSIAERIGLEEGDVILAVNGYKLNYPGAWDKAIRKAAATGHVHLAIRDVNTGSIVYRSFYLSDINPKGKG